MIKAIIIDDEKPSREVIRNYVNEYCEDIKILSLASSVKTGYAAILKYKPDLIFLDIELGDGKGFDLLAKFEKIDFNIIFITAYSEYAIRAFRVNALDYLLKPLKIDELIEAVEKVKSHGYQRPEAENIKSLLKTFATATTIQPSITIPHVKGYDVLKISEIIMCKADGYCTNFHLTNNNRRVSSKNLKTYEEMLSGYNFVRVHHSYIVNLNHVCSYTKQGEIFLTDGLKASLGDAYKEEFLFRFLKK